MSHAARAAICTVCGESFSRAGDVNHASAGYSAENTEWLCPRCRTRRLTASHGLAARSIQTALQPLLDRVRQVLAAEAIAVLLTNQDDEFQLVAYVGLDDNEIRDFRLPSNDPAASIMADRQPWLIDDIRSGASTVASPVQAHSSVQALAILPLRVEDQVIGVMHVGLRDSRSESGKSDELRAVDLGLWQLAAEHVALSIDRQNLYRLERAARVESGTTRRRLSFLAEASALLATSLDYQVTLRQVTELLVPDMCDLCGLIVIEPDGRVNQVAVNGIDPSKAAALSELQSRFALKPDAPSLMRRVLRSGRTEFYPQVSEELLQATSFNDQHRSMVDSIGLHSLMIVPLNARDRTIGALAFVMSDSDRTYTEDDLALAEDLARRAALAVDNARLYHHAQQIAAVQEEFISIASHELKTPLTTVKGYVQLLIRQARHPGQSPERVNRLLAELEQQVRRLEDLVADLLDVSRIEQGRLELRLEPMDLTQLAADVLTRFESSQDRTPAHRFILDAVAHVEGVWDRVRLDQVLTNLLSNALKYSRGGEIRVRLRQFGDRAAMTVSDQGMGFTREDEARLFQPFMRGTAVRAISGTGLGLYISRRIVEGHGGTITAEGKPDAGATFTVHLPLHPKLDDLNP